MKKEIIEELVKKVSDEAANTFGLNYGWAKSLGIRAIAGRKILPIAIYRNRDHGVDPTVMRIDFYENGVSLKSVKLDHRYIVPVLSFYSVNPQVILSEEDGKLIAEINVTCSECIGLQRPFGYQYKSTNLYSCREKVE